MPESELRASIGRPPSKARDPRVHGGAVSSVSLKLLASLCDPKANVVAVCFRSMLVETLLQQGRLDRWREGHSLRDKVFEVAASFPLPRGLENADIDAFVAALG
jgi:hypothetical protein